MPGEELYLYIAVSQAAVSAALVRNDERSQRPVYFISRAFRGAEERYPRMEKLVLVLITAAQKLKPYFQAHIIVVLTDQPLKKAMRLQLDLVDEDRAMAEQRLARYQNLMSKHYNTRVRHRDFQIGDLVLRKVMGTAKDPTQGKLGPNWEGLYRITSWQRKGTYHLETMDGRKLQHPWNTEHLRKYYQ